MHNMPDFETVRKKVIGSSSIEKLEFLLKPGDSISRQQWSDVSTPGFLGPDEKLMDVIKQDYDTLLSLGKTYREMADLVHEFVLAAKKSQSSGNDNLVNNTFLFMGSYSGALQGCPWGCNYEEMRYKASDNFDIHIFEKGKSPFSAETIMSSKKLPFGGLARALYLKSHTVVTSITAHLIDAHCFFQGDAAYRTDPKKFLEFMSGFN